jgi:hypothetical protein
MCITLSVKLGEGLGQNRHCPGVNGCMAASGESIDSMEDVGVELVSRLDDRLIGKVDSGAIVVEVVAVVVTGISMNWKWSLRRWYFCHRLRGMLSVLYDRTRPNRAPCHWAIQARWMGDNPRGFVSQKVATGLSILGQKSNTTGTLPHCIALSDEV